MNKFTLMIADDEKIIRDGLEHSIHWDSLGFNLVAVAADGEEALELFQAYKPEAVIMDIHMPVLSGLEVLEKMKGLRPETEIILLSGYDEFAYAKKGIQQGAFDYVVKINMFPELEEALARLYRVLSHKQEENRQYNQLLLLKNDYTFQQYMKGSPPSELNQAGKPSYYSVASLWLPSPYPLDVIGFYQTAFPLKLILQQDDRYIHFIFLEEGEEFQHFHKKLADCIQMITAHLREIAADAYKIGIGSIQRCLSQIPLMYKEAMKTIDFLRAEDPDNSARSVLLYEDWQGQDTCIEFNNVSSMHWVNWVYTGDAVNLVHWMRTVFAEGCLHKKLSVSDMKYFCLQIAAQFEKMTKVQENKALTLNEFDSIMDLEAYMLPIVQEQCELIHHRAQLQKNENISFIKEYVDEMYRTNLNLEDVARQFYFSPGYLSSKFKEYTGMTFSKYVITKRIETACQLLVRTDMKIYEIASEVGYSDEKHFSKLFTQIMNTGPREYRKHNK
ncbi:putative response regulatory protein [Paenibacillus konkukensis]|uniref:Response regulatory protein n=1 Tax=Paenibacillus konkukensis TaxID=2020716 RepID=A0ABY4REK7_9BACL|nr:response regulator [Paenibacillus konkukensis]UQZ81066.1 putative response regulatory protein [Paenibacillus konkukensis]